jgi:hypothetical protein
MINIDQKQIKLQIWDTVRGAGSAHGAGKPVLERGTKRRRAPPRRRPTRARTCHRPPPPPNPLPSRPARSPSAPSRGLTTAAPPARCWSTTSPGEREGAGAWGARAERAPGQRAPWAFGEGRRRCRRRRRRQYAEEKRRRGGRGSSRDRARRGNLGIPRLRGVAAAGAEHAVAGSCGKAAGCVMRQPRAGPTPAAPLPAGGRPSTTSPLGWRMRGSTPTRTVRAGPRRRAARSAVLPQAWGPLVGMLSPPWQPTPHPAPRRSDNHAHWQQERSFGARPGLLDAALACGARRIRRLSRRSGRAGRAAAVGAPAQRPRVCRHTPPPARHCPPPTRPRSTAARCRRRRVSSLQRSTASSSWRPRPARPTTWRRCEGGGRGGRLNGGRGCGGGFGRACHAPSRMQAA